MTRLFLDEHAWRTLEEAMARIIPTDDTPGAREAGTIVWLDRYLSGVGYIYATPDGSGFIELRGKDADAWRARVDDVRARYREGVDILDRVAADRFGAGFAELDAGSQDRVLEAVEAGDTGGRERESERPSGIVRKRTQAAVIEDDLPFFGLLLLHTRQAFYSDPVYGGNRDHVGWKLVGFHGPETMADALHDRYTTDDYLA